MKKFFILTAILAMAACSGGSGGDGSVNTPIEQITEGTGPALDISNTDKVAGHISSIITSVGSGFDKADDQDSKGIVTKSTGSNAMLAAICSGKTYSKSVSATIKSSSGGSANFTGNISALLNGPDALTASVDLNGEFTEYGINSNIKVGGNAKKTGNGGYTSGMKALCNGQLDGASIKGSISETFSGAFSISGQVGGAVSYKYIVSSDFSFGESEVEYNNTVVEGTADFKSGGKLVTCTIGSKKMGDTDIYSYGVTCDNQT